MHSYSLFVAQVSVQPSGPKKAVWNFGYRCPGTESTTTNACGIDPNYYHKLVLFTNS